jgi:small ligand-binding sensory domain FIST
VRRGLGGRVPDAALVVATAAWGESALRELVAAVADHLGGGAIVGGSVDGILVGDDWAIHRPALAILGLTDVDYSVSHSEDVPCDEARAARELSIGHSSPPDPGDTMILFTDSLGVAPRPILHGLAAALPGLPIVGIGASELEGASPLVWAGPHVASAACAALTIRSKTSPPSIGVTHACRRVGPVHTVTRARGHWVLGLDGHPALDVLRESEGVVFPGRTPLVGLLLDDRVEGDRNASMAVRNVVGFDEARGGFAIPEPVRSGTRLVALAPDADTISFAGDLAAGGSRVPSSRTRAPLWGLYLTCRAAGDGLLAPAVPGGAVSNAMAGAPLLAMSGAYQIAPSAITERGPDLHTHAAIAALFR